MSVEKKRQKITPQRAKEILGDRYAMVKRNGIMWPRGMTSWIQWTGAYWEVITYAETPRKGL